MLAVAQVAWKIPSADFVLLLMQIRITFKNQELLRNVSWDVKRGERVGLVGKHFYQCCMTLLHSLCRSHPLPFV